MFRVGQKVAQVVPWEQWSNYGPAPYADVNYTECGVTYTIRDIIEVRGFTALRFFELRNPEHRYKNLPVMEQPFPAENFRPLVSHKTDISIFEALLTPAGQKEPENG